AFRESLQAFRTVEDDFNTALTLVRLAEASIDAGELQDAAEHLHEAHHVFKQLNRPYMLAVVEGVWGAFHRAHRNYEDAERSLVACLGTLREREPGPDLLNAMFELALVLHEQGETERLVAQLKACIAFSRQFRNDEMADRAARLLCTVDAAEWLKIMSAPFVGQIAEDLKTRSATIAVLCADIRGYTAMSNRLDCEVVAQIVDEFCDEMSKVVYRHNGFVNKFMGDQVMAVFGLGRARHALDPVRAAVEMQEGLAHINLRNSARLSAPIKMGIGIATGEGVAGFFGSPQRREFTVIGNPVHLAAGLQSAASGQIIVCDATCEEIRDEVEVGDLLQIACKGFDRPQEGWVILGLKGDGLSPWGTSL
ncbi:MAG: adenylate/guanylate cyclase domain-containing protein, partial [Candidatus Xenobia bacterium]